MNPNLPPHALDKPVKSKSVRRPIRSRTLKRASDEAKYRRRVRQRLEAEKPICAVSRVVMVVKVQEATQCHHKFGRVGKLLMWEPGWIFVSAQGHAWIDSNKAKARALGLLCEVGQYNSQSLCK